MKLSPLQLRPFRRRLLVWFRRNRRKMPWRGTRDAYRIWLAEVMLQQTRVAAVVDYYRRCVRRFPTVRALARARSEEVLKLWAGLGYYSRARNLHRAAKEIVTRHHGRFPRDFHAALALPGVGRYTAAAVTSMAYGAPHAVLDGNVARVLARLGAVRGDLRAPRRWQQLQQTAQRLLPLDSPPRATHRVAPTMSGDWNQAMMELGATVCTPRAPRCEVCPVSRWCRAYALGVQDALPEARRKRAPVKITLAAAVLLDPRGRTLLVRPREGSINGLFSGMWQFPAVEVERHAREELAGHLRQMPGNASGRRTHKSFVALPPARHTVTFREITLAPFLLRVDALPQIPGARTPLLGRLDGLPVSSATRKIADVVLRELAR